ncbi:hypothetical protein [uncultured Paludibaculum sp.]|uniref:hypothetical protein n=1 Tax=uncultured Paludibaculum sp. TaxID=1765020 RepID=UPI002AAB24B9|nr:hypothetical protein [uncultured Paludibaculum sp.]
MNRLIYFALRMTLMAGLWWLAHSFQTPAAVVALVICAVSYYAGLRDGTDAATAKYYVDGLNARLAAKDDKGKGV